MARHPQRGAQRPQMGELRIIGGEWRSRRVQFIEGPGLRPTPDRVRETLFNWLAPQIEGAHVLDLFSGSGALYLEALSRGAADALALDNSAAAIDCLRQNLTRLGCDNARLRQDDALRFLREETPSAFDLVFLDPPYHLDLLQPACVLLEERGWLAAHAWIYTESESAPSSLNLPATWRLHREKRTGQVHYALWQRG